MTHVLGLYTGVVFEREEKKWLPLARAFLSIQLVKVQNKHELVYRVWAYQDEKLKIEMRILASLKVSRQETFVRMVDEAFQETMGIRFKTKDMANQFFDDVRDVIRKAPAKELVDLPEGHDAKLGVPEETVKLKVHLPADAKGKERKCYVKVDRRTTMGQLLAAIRKSSKVDNPNAWIEIRPNRYNPLPPHFTVSSSVGNLNIREIWVVHNKGPPIPPAIKVTCHLPVGNKVVMEMSPHITIKEMFIYLCDKYKLDKMMHSIVSRNNKTQLLDMTTTVIGSQVLEFVIIRQKYPVKAHEFWGDEKEWADCGDCGFEGLPYTREWYKQRHAERIPPDEDTVSKRDSVSRGDRIQGSQFIRETTEKAEPSKSPLRDTIGRIKEHVRSMKKNKLYPNPGPLSGGDIPESSGDFSKMRRHWTPPKRDTIQDIEFEKAKAMFEQYRNPLSGNSHLYPNMPDLPEPLSVKPELQTRNRTPPVPNPEQPLNQHPAPNPQLYPGGPGTAPQHPVMGYPPNPMFGGMFQGGMMDMWGNRLPAPYYPNYPMFGGYPGPYTPHHPTPGFPPAQTPHQPLPQQTQEEAPPHQQGCSVKESGGCLSNPADPLPGQSLNPVSAHGKSRPAPPPPGRPAEDTPVVQTSRREPFKKSRAPSPPRPVGLGGVRVYSGSQLAPNPHTRGTSRDQGVLSSVRDTLDNVKENVRRYVNRNREENLEDIPEESADLEKPTKAGKKGSLTKKQTRDLVRKKTGELIDGLAGAVHSGNILSNLKPGKKEKGKFDFTGDDLVKHGYYLQKIKHI